MTALEEAIRAEEAAQTLEQGGEPEPGEPEPGEPEPEPGEPEPETEPAPEPSITPEAIKKAERAIETHRRKMADILGPSYVAHDCLLCTGVGFMPELPEPGTVFQLVLEGDEVKFMVQPPVHEPEYRQSADKETCSECDGWGQTLTGSKTPGGRLWQCTRCGGSGFIVKGQPQGAAPLIAMPEFVPQPAPLEGAAVQVPDAWGRPAGHPHWGVAPANVPI